MEWCAIAKGYWVAHMDVDDPIAYEAYKRPMQPRLPGMARFVVRGGIPELREGQSRMRTLIFEFDSYD